MCIFLAVGVACTLQVFGAPVHVQVYTFNRCFLNINVHICDTLNAGCAYVYVYIYVYMHAYVYGCVCASIKLLDTLSRCCRDFLSVCRCAHTCICICVCMCECICACSYVYKCIYVCLCICMHIHVYTRASGCTYVLM